MTCYKSARAKADAVEAGQSTYSTGKPCKRGHVSERFTVNSTCVECDREKYHANAEKRIVQMADYRAANPEKIKALCRDWRQRNPDAVKSLNYQRRARVAAQGSGFTVEQVRAVAAAQGGRCANCKKLLGSSYHADHGMPIALGGAHDIKNIQVLCPPCNHKKHKKDPIVWARQNGRLL